MKNKFIKNLIPLGIVVFIFFMSCYRDKQEYIELDDELAEWANYEEGSWWIYRDAKTDSLLDTIFVLNVKDTVVLYRYKLVDEISYEVYSEERKFIIERSGDIEMEQGNQRCENLFQTQFFNYYVSSRENGMIVFHPAYNYFFDFWKKILVANNDYYFFYDLYYYNDIYLYFPLEVGQTYSDDCIEYEIEDFYNTTTIQNKTYNDVYKIYSKTQYSSNIKHIKDAYFNVWINKDYGILKIQLSADTLIRDIELYKSNIIKNQEL